jgi:hypothetical protein
MSRGQHLSRGFTTYNKSFDINIGRTSLGRNFDVTIGRVAYEACSATESLGTNSAFASEQSKTAENLVAGKTFRMQTDISSSPASNTGTLMSVPIWNIDF